MALELVGKFVQALPLQVGTSARGEWQKQDFLIETLEQYSKKVCISLWAERVKDIEGLQPGETITVSLNLESREYNSRWFTEVRAWRIQRGVVGGASAQPTVYNTENKTSASSDNTFGSSSDSEGSTDDLPF